MFRPSRLRLQSALEQPDAHVRQICSNYLWRLVTSSDYELWPCELKIGTPVTPAPGNVQTNFIYSTLNGFYARQQELL